MAVRRALGRMESVWRCHVLSPIVPFCFPSRLVLRHKGFCSCSSVLCRDSVSMLSVSGGLRSDVEAIHKCILSCFELSQVAR